MAADSTSNSFAETHHVIDDIIATETTYSQSMRILKIHFSDKLLHDAQSPKPQVLPFDPDNAVFFSSVGQLLTVHQSFLQELEEKRKLSDVSGYIDTLSRFATLFRVYTQYVAGYFAVMQKISETFESQAKGRKFREMLNEASISMTREAEGGRPGSIIEISEDQATTGYCELVRLLLMPLNHVQNYSRTLEEFSNAVNHILPSEAPALETWKRQIKLVENAFEKTTKAIQHTNDLEGQRTLIIDLESQWGVKFSGAIGRMHIKDGILVKVSRSKDIPYVFLLFSDILCYGAPKTGTIGTLSGIRGRVAHHRTIPLSKVTVTDSTSRENSFQIISDEKSFVVVAPSLEEKDEWLRKITAAIQGLKDATAASSASRAAILDHASSSSVDDGFGASAPVWTQDHDVNNCTLCAVSFSLINRRHHCRRCGNIVCNSCSNYKLPKHRVIVGTAVPSTPGQVVWERVCNTCATIILPTLTAQEMVDYNKKSASVMSMRFSSSPVVNTSPTASASPALLSPSRPAKDTTTDTPPKLPSVPPPIPRTLPPSSVAASKGRISPPPQRKSPTPNEILPLSLVASTVADMEFQSVNPIAQPPKKKVTIDTPEPVAGTGFRKPSPPRGQLQRQMSKKAPALPPRRCPPPPIPSRSARNLEDTGPQAQAVVKTHRQLVVEEVLSTEETYVRNLSLMLNSYAAPLLADSRARKPTIGKVCFISSEDNLVSMSVFFHSIEQIHTLNCQLLEDLRLRVSELQQEENNRRLDMRVPSTVTIGDIFSKYGPLFSLYSTYTDTQEFAAKTLSEYGQKNNDFRDFVTLTEEGMSNEKTKIYLQSLLITPIQRVPRYHLLLQECHKQTQKIDPGHVDLALLQDALDRVKDSASYINSVVHIRENKAKILVLEQQWNGFQLFVAGRVLIKDGPLHKQCRHKVKTFQFLLFSDVLMYGEEDTTGNTVTHHRTMALDTCRVTDMHDIANDTVSFQIISKQKAFVVYADSSDVKDEWLDALTQSISAKKRISMSAMRLKMKKKDNGVEQPASAVANQTNVRPSSGNDDDDDVYAAVWVPNRESHECQRCHSNFSFFKRRHHCRLCGILACDDCTNMRITVESIDDKPVRVCGPCYDAHVTRLDRMENERKYEEECKMMSQQKKASITQLNLRLASEAATLIETNKVVGDEKVDIKVDDKSSTTATNTSNSVAVSTRTSDESSSSESGASSGESSDEENGDEDDDEDNEKAAAVGGAVGENVTPVDNVREGTDASGNKVVFPVTVQALYKFESSNDGELGVKANEILTVKQEQGDWWLGRNCNDERGWLPKTFVKIISDQST